MRLWRKILDNYKEWVSTHIKVREDYWRKCESVTLRMKEAFPELIRVRGHYHDIWFGPIPHWWLKTEDGTIIDPTCRQFSEVQSWDMSGHHSLYAEVDDENLPTGKCPNCGEYSYNRMFCCSENCYSEYRAYCMEAV
jgi:hypothetical protein